MNNIIGISGSLRKGSFNTALLKAAAEMSTDIKIEICSIAQIPLYNGDVEAQGIPKEVLSLQEKFQTASGILFATPEYNNGVPGVLKNTIDWLSRPPSIIEKVFGGKPVAMIGATMGNFGTLIAQSSWLTTWRVLHVDLWNEQFPYMVSKAQNAFDSNGNVLDPKITEGLRKYINGFTKYILSQKILGS